MSVVDRKDCIVVGRHGHGEGGQGLESQRGEAGINGRVRKAGTAQLGAALMSPRAAAWGGGGAASFFIVMLMASLWPTTCCLGDGGYLSDGSARRGGARRTAGGGAGQAAIPHIVPPNPLGAVWEGGDDQDEMLVDQPSVSTREGESGGEGAGTPVLGGRGGDGAGYAGGDGGGGGGASWEDEEVRREEDQEEEEEGWGHGGGNADMMLETPVRSWGRGWRGASSQSTPRRAAASPDMMTPPPGDPHDLLPLGSTVALGAEHAVVNKGLPRAPDDHLYPPPKREYSTFTPVRAARVVAEWGGDGEGHDVGWERGEEEWSEQASGPP